MRTCPTNLHHKLGGSQDAKSAFTAQHSSRVTTYAVALGKTLELSDERQKVLRRAAFLHDIGKLGISNSILDKPGKLDQSEFSRIQQHPKYSFEILDHIRGFSEVAEIAGAHHERLDGKGYHLGKAAEQLSIEMRILATADVFDALTADRPYRKALSTEESLQIMNRDAGTAFDPVCLEALDLVSRRRSASNAPQLDRR
jgi:putative nucleotidyltransferase with HDIG domain